MDFWDQNLSLNRICCVDPDPYHPVVQFRFIGRIKWWEFCVFQRLDAVHPTRDVI